MRAIFINEAFERKTKEKKRTNLTNPRLKEITDARSLVRLYNEDVDIPRWKIDEIIEKTDNISQLVSIITMKPWGGDIINDKVIDVSENEIDRIIRFIKTPHDFNIATTSGFKIPDDMEELYINNIKDINSMINTEEDMGMTVPEDKKKEIIEKYTKSTYEIKDLIHSNYKVPEHIVERILGKSEKYELIDIYKTIQRKDEFI